MRHSFWWQIALMLAAAPAAAGFAAVHQDPRPVEEPRHAIKPADPPVAVFTAHSDLVVLHVNVLDGKSDAVVELPQSAFQVLEDGVPQRIEFFDNRDVPVAIGLVIDNSSSMLTRRPMTVAGVDAFAGSALERDELFMVVFNEHVRFGLGPSVPFTSRHDMLQGALARFPAGGKTALHDAVIEALAHIEQASNQKRAIVVLSDGDDNASHHSEANMLHRASRSQALVHAIWTGEASRPGNPRLLRRLASKSGGVAYTPGSQRDVVAAFAAVGRSIRRGYSIGYVPTNTARDGGYRRVQVSARVPGKRLSVRARDGYTAADDRDADAR